MTNVYEILRRPIITEKSNFQSGKLNQVVFEVSKNATKAMIKDAVEKVFDVKVKQVNVLIMPAKKKMAGMSRKSVSRRQMFKKAIVTLEAGNSIDVFEGVH